MANCTYAYVVRETIVFMQKSGKWLLPAAAETDFSNEVVRENHQRAVEFLAGACVIAIERAGLPDIPNNEIDAHVRREAQKLLATGE